MVLGEVGEEEVVEEEEEEEEEGEAPVQEACPSGEQVGQEGGDCFQTCQPTSSTCWRRGSILRESPRHVAPSTARLCPGCRAQGVLQWLTTYQVYIYTPIWELGVCVCLFVCMRCTHRP